MIEIMYEVIVWVNVSFISLRLIRFPEVTPKYNNCAELLIFLLFLPRPVNTRKELLKGKKENLIKSQFNCDESSSLHLYVIELAS